jgi:hypothetical protein
MGEICKKLEHLEQQQAQILKVLNGAQWFLYGIGIFILMDQVGVLSALKVIL